MKDKNFKCSECEHCENHGRAGNTRGSFYCGHPDYEYIVEFYKKHRINRAFGFIAFGNPFENFPAIKTSPKWCPKKKEC